MAALARSGPSIDLEALDSRRKALLHDQKAL